MKREVARLYINSLLNTLFTLMKTLKTLIEINLGDDATRDVSFSIAENILTEAIDLADRTKAFYELPREKEETV